MKNKNRKKRKNKSSALVLALKILLPVVLVLIIVVSSYAAYVFIDYERIEDNLELEVTDNTANVIEVSKEYKMLSYNIGFCAYTQDFSFFMDGGKESRAKSESSVNNVLNNIDALLQEQDADIVLMQEADENATRSHHVNQRAFFTENAKDCDSVFATNFDSAYLFYPVFKPHGKSLSGILTLSSFDIESSTRRSLPVEDSAMKIVDLDRCFSKSVLNTDNARKLILYNVHLSAYTSDGTIATNQLRILVDDMKYEFNKGNYVICGGDFNKDLLQDSGEIFGVSGEDYTWAQPFPTEMIDDTGLELKAPYSEDNPVASCRDTQEPYKESGQFKVTLDGFIVSNNVEVTSCSVIDTKFMYSDHNPVYMNFSLKK